MISGMSSNFSQIIPPTAELAAPGHLEKLGTRVVATSAPLLFSGSSPFLQVIRTTIKSRMSSKVDQIQSLTAE